jgi:hypothetical protein
MMSKLKIRPFFDYSSFLYARGGQWFHFTRRSFWNSATAGLCIIKPFHSQFKFRTRPLGEGAKLCYRGSVPRYSLQKLRSLSREFDLFEPDARDWAPLLESGLCPPLPVAGGALVWGFPILAAAERARLGELPCVELPADDGVELLTIALRLENRPGAYSRREQARLYAFLTAAGLEERVEQAPERRGLIGLITEERPAAWFRQMREYAAFSEPLKRLLDENLLDMKTAGRARSLPEAFFELLYSEKSRFGFSERRQFVTLVWEIAQRDRLTADDAMTLAREALSEKDPWPRLRALRCPEYAKRLAAFSAIASALEREGIAARPPAMFEGESISFGFTATSRAVYERKLAALGRFEEQVDRLFELL